MSCDINFWKLERPLILSAQEIYTRLCDGEEVEGLAILPVEDILAKLKEAFPDFDPSENYPLVQTSEGTIEFSWSNKRFRFDLRGICSDCQKLVDIMTDFGCPMYDPQEDKRYDSMNGTALGDSPPKFEDMTLEQKAEIERIKREFLAKIDSPKKKGCFGPATILVLGTFGLFCAATCLIGRGN
jgi:hypothetical protein